MSEHLSSRQIAEWILGDRTAAEELHVGDCAKCRREIDSFEGSLSLYAHSVRDWSDRQQTIGSHGISLAPRSAKHAAHPLRWATAAAGLALLLSGIAYQHRLSVVEHEHQRQEAVRADAALMEQVDTEVSQSVPATLEPLAQLMYVDAETGEQNTQTQKKTINDRGDRE